MKWTLTRLLIALFLSLTALTACSTKPYLICDGTACRAVSKSEALEAAEVAKEWGASSKLQLKIQKNPL